MASNNSQQQQTNQQSQQFDNSQFGMFSPLNGPLNSSESSMSSSPPLASPPSFVNPKRPSLSSSSLTNLAQQNSTNIAHSVSASSFFPTGSFPFSPQYSQNLNNISSNPASNSISNLNSQPQAKNSHMSGNPNAQQLNNVGLISGPASSTSNFFPNSISSIVEDAPTTKSNSLVALRVSNLPRDIQLREFNVLFTFAPDFVYTELAPAPTLSEDGLPTSVVGLGYFKSLPAASNAMAVLTRNPLIFAPREIFNRPNVSTSPYMLKCDIRTNVRQNEAARGLGYNLSPPQAPQQQQSQQQQQHNSTSPVTLLPQQPQPNVGPFKSSSSRFVFSSGGISTPQMELSGQNYSDVYSEPSGVLSPSGMFSPTSPRSIFPGEPDFMARISGKSLLLESQGKEDEEYNNMVKDPMGWFNMNNGYSGMPESNPPPPVGYNGSAAPGGQTVQQPKPKPQSGPAQQAPVQPQGSLANNQQSGSSSKDAGSKPSSAGSKSARNSMGGAAPANGSTASNNNSNGPPSGPNPWNDKRRGSTLRGFQNLSVGNDNKNGTFSATTSNTNPTTSTAGSSSTLNSNNGSNGNSNDNNSNNNSNNNSGTSSASVILPGGATRVLPPANPADQNPPCNTLYVGNLPPDTNEDELKDLFSARQGYKRLCFRTKANGPMCFVEFEDVSYAGQALEQLYGVTLSNSVKGGIRLSYSKNPLGVRSSTTAGGSNQSRLSSGNGGSNNGYGASRNYNGSSNY